MHTWTVYIIFNTIQCYIGITTRPLQERHREHMRQPWAANSTIEPLEEVVGTRKDAERREQILIWKHIKMGYDVLNIKHIPSDKETFIQALSQVPFV